MKKLSAKKEAEFYRLSYTHEYSKNKLLQEKCKMKDKEIETLNRLIDLMIKIMKGEKE